MVRKVLAAVTLAVGLTAASCSGGSGSDGPDSTTTSSTTLPAPTTTTSALSVADASFTLQQDIAYGEGEVEGGGVFEELLLDLYVPDPAPSGPVPGIVMVHGGGFTTGSKRDGEIARPAEAYAKAGFVVASIDYRLQRDDPIASDRIGGLWAAVGGATADRESRTFAAAVDDILGAIEFLRAHDLVDPDRIVVWGFSAGATAALYASYVLDDYGDDPPDVQAVIALAGIIFESESVGNPFDDPAGDPPLLVIHGDLDFEVDFENATRLRDWAEAAGLGLEFQAVEGAGHFVDLFQTDVSPGVSLHRRTVDWLNTEIFAG